MGCAGGSGSREGPGAKGGVYAGNRADTGRRVPSCVDATPDLSIDPNRLDLPALWRYLSATGLPRRLFELARDEDLGPLGVDLTTVGDGDDSQLLTRLVFREPGVVAGLSAASELAEVFGGGVRVEPEMNDGEIAERGMVGATVMGERGAVLALERTLLNLVGRLSGVATRTRAFVRALDAGGGRAELYDTRKTTPGLRVLEKYAVRCGGGMNHRLGLHDAVMVKDNHLLVGGAIDDAGTGERVAGLLDAIEAGVRARGVEPPRFIEVEVDRVGQLSSVLEVCGGRVDVVLLDNMALKDLREAAAMRDRLARGVKLEASGGVTLESVGAIGATGVDRVSVGSLTHGAVGVDVGLDG